MIGYILLGVALFIGFVLLAQWYVTADPKTVARVLRWGSVVLAVLGLALVAVLRAWNWLPAVFFALMPWLLQSRMRRRMAGARRGPSAGQVSSVETDFLSMILDHDTGAMAGTVRRGQFEGQSLDQMSLSELLDLMIECHVEDEQSAAVLAAYLDRIHPDWRTQAGAAAGAGRTAPASSGSMSAEEAREILGVGEQATENDIKEAHRRLMKQYHPDHGGSSYLAAKINEAKEVLLGS